MTPKRPSAEDVGVPTIGTVDAVLRIISRNLALYKWVLGACAVLGAIATPWILSGLIVRLISVLASSGTGATAVAVAPFLGYRRWSARREICADYRRLLGLQRRNPAKLEPYGFRTATRHFWELYADVMR